jgi:predicted ribosome quality control (RQC) complex YloA/Tae2 family protein
MDPLALARVTPELRHELLDATWAGLRPIPAGFEVVFDRAPDGDRPARRLALRLRFAPPLWAWLDDAGRDGRDFAYRPPEGTRVTGVETPPLDRRLVVETSTPGGHALCLHAELWGPGNAIVEEKGDRIVWAARVRKASTQRGAIASDLPYPLPAAGEQIDPGAIREADIASLLDGVEPDRRLLVLARRVAGLPKGVLEALAPSLPGLLFAEPLDAGALARDLGAWATRAFAPDAGSVWGVASAGAAQLVAFDPGDASGFTRSGPAPSWAAAARALGRALPDPVDAAALSAAKAVLRRLERTEASVLADLERAGQAEAVRAQAQALAAFLPRVTRGASKVTLPDPADATRTLDIELDPKLKPHENADRLFRRAAKMERARERAPAHLAEIRAAIARARAAVAAVEQGEPSELPAPRLSSRPAAASAKAKGKGAGAGGRGGAVPAALEPRRFRSSEGWEVWIGKSNQGNDHLTHRLARPEDVWMHVHGAAGSHVVLRRGKGPNEPSKATLTEVAGWAAFYSQARNAGTVPVTVTQKKFVRKPRKAPAGLAQVERAKTVFARPTEPPDGARIGDEL